MDVCYEIEGFLCSFSWLHFRSSSQWGVLWFLKILNIRVLVCMDTHLGFVVIFKIMRPSPLPSFSLFWWWPDNMANVYGCIICLWMSTFEPSVGSFPSCRFSYGFLSFFYNSSGPAIIFDEFFEARVGWRFKVSVKEFHLGFCFWWCCYFLYDWKK